MYRAAITEPATYGEDVMAAKRTWRDLDESTRKLIIAVAVAEGTLKVAALIDIKRRPASQIRGPKWLWAPRWQWSTPPGSCRSHTSSSGGGSRGRNPADMHRSTRAGRKHHVRHGLTVAQKAAAHAAG